MQRICFVMEILPGQEQEYERRHEQVWPELIQELRAAGVRNYSLFRLGTQVIAYAECEPDAETAFAAVGRTEPNRRWAEWFADVLAVHTDGNGRLVEAPEVWHLD